MAKLKGPVPKFTRVERERIQKRLKALVRERLTYVEVASALNAEGFRTPAGKRINTNFVSNVLYRLRKTGKFRMSNRGRPKKVSPLINFYCLWFLKNS